MIALAVVYALICGLCFRLRGSALWDIWTGSGTTGGRIQYAATAALLLAALKVDMHLLALGPALWLGCVLPWWNHGLVPRDAESFAANASRGVFWLLPCAPVLWWAGYDGWGVLLVAGAFSGPIYA
ncbi:hypothetical protein, partial [Tepidimonas sp.]|uniref:hypothetical protein n=1 Tax=Tepidimonas sp. TaxID=2002775 RepID=UPI00391DBDC0